jgi:hypothetical protein
MEEINVEVAFARKTLSSPNSSLAPAPILESIPALTLAISDANQVNFHPWILLTASTRHIDEKNSHD